MKTSTQACYDLALRQWLDETPATPKAWSAQAAEPLRIWCERGDALVGEADRPEQPERRKVCREAMAAARVVWARAHGEQIYRELTKDYRDSLRVTELVRLAVARYPGLLPNAAELAADADRALHDKFGHELSVGLVLAQWLGDPCIGRHLLASMRRPLSAVGGLLDRYRSGVEIDLGAVRLQRRGSQGHLTLSNSTNLNAEDERMVEQMELAVDLILSDEDTEVGVLRGGVMQHEKYRGRRVFCSGVNLTKLYAGQLPFLFYIERELGLVSKIYRGLWGGGPVWEDAPDLGLEKPWVAAVDSHAIGGGCQLLLVCDHVIAESSSFLSLPARAEGFIPGIANLRLLQFVGRRLANRLIYRNGTVASDSPEGRMLVDQVVADAEMEASIEAACADIAVHGVAGLAGNRKAFRHATEPVDQFLAYMSTFCREQARCMYGDEILRNLERFWMGRARAAV